MEDKPDKAIFFPIFHTQGMESKLKPVIFFFFPVHENTEILSKFQSRNFRHF